MVGDQFALIALPWLVLRLTGDALALGLVLALAGIPRAAFMLLGGAITDRFSPRNIMLASDLIRLALSALMAALILSGAIQLWMLYAFSLVFGTVAGFFTPASNTMVPTLIAKDRLQAGNAVIQGTSLLGSFVGPTLAGGVIGWFAHVSTVAAPGLTGIGLAFGIDALTYLISVATLWAMGAGRQAATSEESVLAAIRNALRQVWDEPFMRLLFIIIALTNLLVQGPLLVGLPLLANTRLPDGAVAFGLIMSAFAGGGLIGILLAGSLPRPGGSLLRFLIPTLLGGFGAVLAGFGWVSSTWVAFGLLLIVGVGYGYLAIIIVTLLQRRTPMDMLGRIMSFMMFASLGLVPISQALSGAVSRWGLAHLFAGAGALLLGVAAWTAVQPAMARLDAILAD